MKKYNIITLERQFASGGTEICRLLSEKLGIKYYGGEILDIAAERSGMSREYLGKIEESVTNSMLYSIAMSPEAAMRGADIVPPTERLFQLVCSIVQEIAERESCIILGHAAGAALSSREDCLRVFIYADTDSRIQRAVDGYGYSEKEAPGIVRKSDKRRAGYYNSNFCLDWEDKEGYHMMLDSGKMGLEGCVNVIATEFNK